MRTIMNIIAVLSLCFVMESAGYAQNAPSDSATSTPAAKATKKYTNYVENSVLRGKNSPKELEIFLGDSFSVIQPWGNKDPGLFDPIPCTATVTVTDKDTGEVLKSVVSSPVYAGGVFVMWKFDTVRVGTCEIVFTNDLNNKEFARIKVTVKKGTKHDLSVEWKGRSTDNEIRAKLLSIGRVTHVETKQVSGTSSSLRITIESDLSQDELLKEIRGVADVLKGDLVAPDSPDKK